MSDYFHSCVAVVIHPNNHETPCRLPPIHGPLCASHAAQFKRASNDVKHYRRILRTSLKHIDADMLADVYEHMPDVEIKNPPSTHLLIQDRVKQVLSFHPSGLSGEAIRHHLLSQWGGCLSRGQVGAAIRSLKADGSIESRHVKYGGRRKAIHSLF
jgi:cysteine sulfinate desulfinase/cysteine desulfurase-like protein